MGKTHLANAIGTKIKELYPEKRVLYVSWYSGSITGSKEVSALVFSVEVPPAFSSAPSVDALSLIHI